jgi:hypothetical protein
MSERMYFGCLAARVNKREERADILPDWLNNVGDTYDGRTVVHEDLYFS